MSAREGAGFFVPELSKRLNWLIRDIAKAGVVMGKKHVKTNAIRILENAGIAAQMTQVSSKGEFLDALTIAQELGVDASLVFKTLVLEGEPGQHFVAVVPATHELDLKAAAKCFGVKHLEMLPLKKLTPLTGYLKGACSPLGMKKDFPTVIDQSAFEQDRIYVSAGKRGYQILVAAADLQRVISAKQGDISRP